MIRWLIRRFIIDDEILTMSRNNGYLLALNDMSNFVLETMREHHADNDVAGCELLDRIHKRIIWLMEQRTDKSDYGR